MLPQYPTTLVTLLLFPLPHPFFKIAFYQVIKFSVTSSSEVHLHIALPHPFPHITHKHLQHPLNLSYRATFY